MKKLVAGIVIGVVMAGCGAAVADRGSNDHVLHEDQYQEFFKQEGNGSKNYLYTATNQVDAPAPGKCVVVTANSEQTIAIYCNTPGR